MYDEMISAIKNTSVVAVGPRTQKELRSFGIRAAHMPENYSSIGLGEMFTVHEFRRQEDNHAKE